MVKVCKEKDERDRKDLSGFKDPSGKKLFIEMVKVCKEKGEKDKASLLMKDFESEREELFKALDELYMH